MNEEAGKLLAMKNPFDGIPSPEKAELMAQKRTARLKEQAGLFADCIEPVTAEQIIRAAEAHRDRFDECNRRLREKGERFRARVQLLVSPAAFAVIEERFAGTPGTPEYLCDFYRHELKRLGVDPDGV